MKIDFKMKHSKDQRNILIRRESKEKRIPVINQQKISFYELFNKIKNFSFS